MQKRFFIYEVLGWPDGPLVLRTVTVPTTKHAYLVDADYGYETVAQAEQQLQTQKQDEYLQGEFVILPVYRLEID